MDTQTSDQNQGKTTNTPPTGDSAAATALDAKKAEILARIRAADPDRVRPDVGTEPDDSQQGDPGSSGVHAPAQAGSTPAPVTTPAATAQPSATDTAIAEMRAQLAALTAKLDPPKAEPAPAAAADRYEALKTRIAEDPYAIFEEFPELLTIEKVSDAHLRRVDNPAAKELTAHQREIADLKKKIEEREKADAEAQAKTQAESAAKAGRDVIKGVIEGEKGRWARISRSDDNLSEAIDLAAAAGKGVVAELRKTKGEKWLPTDDEAKAILLDCLDRVEKDFEARAARYGKPDITPAPAGAAPPARKTIPAAGSSTGAARAADPPPKPDQPTDLSARKAEILRTVRRNARQPQA